MPKFLVLIHDDESKLAGASAQELGDVGAAHGAFAEANGPLLRGGGRIGPLSESVSIVEGKVESKPLLDTGAVAVTGFYILETDSLEQAVDAAKAIPSNFGGGLEVRPLVG